jgi:orotidine-5'-phosphate decarboxylase
VNADSLFEAAVLALQAFKASGWSEGIGPATQVEVEVRVTTTRHVVERGADPTVDGRGVGQSRGAAERDRLKAMLREARQV